MVMVPQMSTTAASLVQVPAQHVIIQQAEPRVFMGQTVPAQAMAAPSAATGNIFLPQSTAPAMGYAAVPMAAPSQPMAAVPMAAMPAAAAVPAAIQASPFAGGTITNQAIALSSGESSTRFEVEAPSRFRTRLANVLQSASNRVRGRVRLRAVQETEFRSPQGQTGGGGMINISNAFATQSMAQTMTPMAGQPQAAPPCNSPPCAPPRSARRRTRPRPGHRCRRLR